MLRRNLENLEPLSPTLPDSTSPLPPNLSSEVTIFIDRQKVLIRADKLQSTAELGRGQFGRVDRMVHTPTGHVFAVKMIEIDQERLKRTQIQRDLEISNNTTCPCLVMCYGGLLYNSQVMVLMELMDLSLHNLRKQVYGAGNVIPEDVLAYMLQRVVTGLEFLRSDLRVMHRDVKPSNMLADRHGAVKVCDFGISGDLVRSVAVSNVGTNRYLAPERINPSGHEAFRIQSDVWSLGLSVMELATGNLCFANMSIFEQLSAVVYGPVPRLPANDRFSVELQEFVCRCLVKEPVESRANYLQLLDTAFLRSVDIAEGKQKLSSFLVPYLHSTQ